MPVGDRQGVTEVVPIRPRRTECAFCARLSEVEASGPVASFPDAFPVSDGHRLVIPTRHERDLFRLPRVELAAVWDLVAAVRDELARDLHPDGFNIGVNVGAAAGQTVEHAHVHIIPRYEGDVPDPRGGVRWVLPDQANYWSSDE